MDFGQNLALSVVTNPHWKLDDVRDDLVFVWIPSGKTFNLAGKSFHSETRLDPDTLDAIMQSKFKSHNTIQT